MSKVSSYTSWQPLEEVIVGRAYTPDYFDFIDNAQVREQLQLILAETNEDLDNLQKTCEEYGAVVKRPNLPGKDNFQKWQTAGQGAPLPPLTPRDWQITLGDKLLRVLPIDELNDICKEYGDQVINPHGESFDPDCILNGASASCIVRVGRDVFFDNSEHLRPDQTDWIVQNVLGSEYRIHEAITDGHGDAVFAILKPGVLLSSKWDDQLDLAGDFPGWDVCKIWDSSIWAAMEVGKFKEENFNGAWYVQGQTPTKEFGDFVDTYLNKWVGFVSDTVFDVNCLVLDDRHVVVNSDNPYLLDNLRKNDMEPIVCPLRHRFFWDGGWHCLTLDIKRKGGQTDYGV